MSSNFINIGNKVFIDANKVKFIMSADSDMASIALEQFKITAFIKAGLNKIFHRNTEHL